MWVEQFLNWGHYRCQVVTVVVLAVNTALLIILGFLPLLDNFYHILAIGCGMLLAPALLRPRVVPLLQPIRLQLQLQSLTRHHCFIVRPLHAYQLCLLT